ncbi:MAG: GH3 auxin-responsive promoter family protein [Myxococcota bacterium]
MAHDVEHDVARAEARLADNGTPPRVHPIAIACVPVACVPAVPRSPMLTHQLARAVGALPSGSVRALSHLLFTRTTRELSEAVRDVHAAQTKRLRQVMERNSGTEVGRRYDFGRVRTLRDLQAAMPLCTWSDMEALVDRMVEGEPNILVAEDPLFYATTSGTTGRRKLIPVTPSFMEECRVATRLLLRTSLTSFPELLRGKRLSMRSPHIEDLGGGRKAGSITVALSGGLARSESAFDAVPSTVFEVEHFESRYRLCLRFALQEDVRLVSAINPSTLLLFARTLEENAERFVDELASGRLGDELVLSEEQRRELTARARPSPLAARRLGDSLSRRGRARMVDVFPGLCGLVAWKGGSAPWYLAQLRDSYGDLPILDYGYVASEGCFGAPLTTEGASSLLLPHGHLFELIPEEELEAVLAGHSRPLELHEAERGQRYYVVVTTSAGLYRYQMNDVVEVTGHIGRAPLVVFRHKGGNMSSLTGEKLGESHVVNAMDRLAADTRGLQGFTVAPLLPLAAGEAPRYLLLLDGMGAWNDDERGDFARRFDESLRRENVEYDAKRQSLRLGPLEARTLPDGAFARHRARRVAAGAPDAHVKTPHLSRDGALLEELGLAEVDETLVSQLPCRRGL